MNSLNGTYANKRVLLYLAIPLAFNTPDGGVPFIMSL